MKILLLILLSSCAAMAPKSKYIFEKTKVFNGDQYYYSVNDSGMIAADTSKFSFASWIRVEKLQSQVLYSISLNNPNPPMSSRASMTLQADGRIQLFGRTQDAVDPTVEVFTKKAHIKTNEWMHLAGTIHFDENRFEIYVNGKLVELDAPNTKFSNTKTPNTYSRYVTLGSEDDGSGLFFIGQMAHAIFKRAVFSQKDLEELVKDKP